MRYAGGAAATFPMNRKLAVLHRKTASFINGILFMDGDGHAEFGALTGANAVHVFLCGHIVDNAVICGQAVPRLDAHIGSLRFRFVPQPEIGHVGV